LRRDYHGAYAGDRWRGLDPLRILVLSRWPWRSSCRFAMIPLVLFTSNRKIMGTFTNRRVTKLLAWAPLFLS
jgi:manganese transport protein